MKRSGSLPRKMKPLPKPATTKGDYNVNYNMRFNFFQGLLKSLKGMIIIMNDKENYELFLDGLLSRAVEEYQETNEYYLMKQQLEQMDRDCETMLLKDQFEFVNECFEIISDVKGSQEQYVYRKGLRDSIIILKNLGVLA